MDDAFGSVALRFLSGEAFANGHSFWFGKRSSPIDRFLLVRQIFRGKKVIHVGCVDHLPLLERKIHNGLWMHEHVHSVAHRCLGVDINSEGVTKLRDKYNYQDVLCADLAERTPAEILGDSWDFLFFGELLEHIDNPVSFLTEIHSRYQSSVAQILVTVPNAFQLGNFTSARRGYECINTDHRYWFTPFTLAKTVVRAGFLPQSVQFVFGSPHTRPRGLRSRLREWTLARYPMLRDTIALSARFER